MCVCLPIVLLLHTLPKPEFVCLSQISSGLVSLPGRRGGQPPGALSEWQASALSLSLSAGSGLVERLGFLLAECLLLCFREGSCLLCPEQGWVGGGELYWSPTGCFVSAFDMSRLVGTQFLQSGITTDSVSGHPRMKAIFRVTVSSESMNTR